MADVECPVDVPVADPATLLVMRCVAVAVFTTGGVGAGFETVPKGPTATGAFTPPRCAPTVALGLMAIMGDLLCMGGQCGLDTVCSRLLDVLQLLGLLFALRCTIDDGP
jgi:hypothetical protein